MKLKSILQTIKCSHCRCALPVLEHKRILNFTEGETTLFCKNCHRKIGMIPFIEWNKLQRDKFEKPELAQQEAKRLNANRGNEREGERGRGNNRRRRRRR